METTYKMSDIKPDGNFDFVLNMFNKKLIELEDKKEYSSSVANFLKVFIGEVGVIDALEEFEEPYEGWNKEEQKSSLLYAHLIVIRANNIAQKYLNNIEMEPNHIQLMEYINGKEELKNVFGKLTIEE